MILTGVAVRRANARAIGELFAREAGKLVAVSAGDSLETVMAAYGSGAVARSIRDECVVMNVDVGGGTSKIAVCAEGKVIDVAALDVGARLICLEPDGRIVRVEEAGRRFGDELGLDLKAGGMLTLDQGRALSALMADKLFEAMRWRSASRAGRGPASPRSPHPPPHGRADSILRRRSEFIYGNETEKFGDLGPLLAAEIRARAAAFCPQMEEPLEGIRATVVGASQYTIQLSGSTIYVAPLDAVPLRNVPVIAPALPARRRDDRTGQSCGRDPNHAQAARSRRWRAAGCVVRVLAGFGNLPAARCVLPRRGRRPARVLSRGHPLVLAGDGDVGGLLGIHLREEMKIANPIVSIDGLELKEFDYIDIGAMLDSSGAVPVVIKSLIFPGSAPPTSRERRPTPSVHDDQQQSGRSDRTAGGARHERTASPARHAKPDRMQRNRREHKTGAIENARPPPANSAPCA